MDRSREIFGIYLVQFIYARRNLYNHYGLYVDVGATSYYTGILYHWYLTSNGDVNQPIQRESRDPLLRTIELVGGVPLSRLPLLKNVAVSVPPQQASPTNHASCNCMAWVNEVISRARRQDIIL